jgi:hypothetical protein
LNNVIEQPHRRIKQRVQSRLGFKRFGTASAATRGVELAEKIKKEQFNIAKLVRKAATAPAVLTARDLESDSLTTTVIKGPQKDHYPFG